MKTIQAITLIALLVPALGVAAEEQSIIFLLEKISELETRIEKLESPGTPSATLNQNLSNWRKLQTGMSYSQVRILLGEPLKINGGVVANWYYSQSERAGPFATFVSDSLTSWQEP